MTITRVQIPQSNYSTNHGANQLKKIVLHWIVGELASCDATFKNPERQASAHYGIGSTGDVHQYVEDRDIAWHAGPKVNYESIGIEHAGGQLLADGTRKKPTQICHDTSAELVAMKCKQYNIPCDREHIRKHSEYMATSCPGSLDIDYIISKANLILTGATMLDFEIIKQDGDLRVKILSGSFNGTATIKNLTANTSWTTNVNRKAGETSGVVCDDYGKSLYEVTLGSVVRTIDLRDPPAETIEEVKAKLTKAESDIKVLEGTIKVNEAKIAELTEKCEEEIEAMKKTITEKDQTILQLREVAGVGILERIWKKIVGFINKKI